MMKSDGRKKELILVNGSRGEDDVQEGMAISSPSRKWTGQISFAHRKQRVNSRSGRIIKLPRPTPQ